MNLSARRSLAAVTGLGVTQIIGYGTLFYSFSILAPEMGRDFSQSREWLFGIFSGTLLIGGLVSPWSGRWADRFGAGRVMALGSLAAAVSLALCAIADQWLLFAAAMISTGLATPFTLYNTAFAVLVQVDPAAAPRRITYLTLMGGFSSTLFWPLTSQLLGSLTWQGIFLVYAALHIFICLPIHYWLSLLTRRTDAVVEGTSSPRSETPGSVPEHRRDAILTLIAAAFALTSFALSSLLIHMVPVFVAIGLGAAAVYFGTIFGPSQFASRLVNMLLGPRFSPMTVAMFSTALIPLAFVVLLLAPPIPLYAAAFIFALLFGMGSGLNSIVLGTLPLSLFGSLGYGQILGRITSIRLIVSSIAPFIFAFFLERFGPHLALGVATGAGLAGLAIFVLVAAMIRKSEM
jgi:hypothetical protein